jgi:hypothetical protein
LNGWRRIKISKYQKLIILGVVNMSQRCLFLVFGALLLAISSICLGEGSSGAVWKLVWEDNFERAEIGDGWQVSGEASIVDGRMKLVGTVAPIINRSFAHDVRLEFDAWAIPGIPPCDISAVLACGEGVGWGYLLGFGAQGNHVNHLKGPGVNFEDKNPPFLIEQGKRYHCIAEKEGKRISYTVNSHKLMEVTVENPLGGPNFDRVGVLTWTGMFVDNVKVYERITPHPDTPPVLTALPAGPLYRSRRELIIREGFSTSELEEAVAAFNEGKLTEALNRFRSMGSTLAGLLGQAYVLGDLGYMEPFHNPEFKRLAQEFEAASKANPNDRVLAHLTVAAQWFSHLEMSRNAKARVSATRLVGLGEANNPFYYKALLYQARYVYWDGKESGNPKLVDQAVDQMRNLKKLWPENTILRQYTGELVPWGEDLIADTAKHPAWAAYLREAYARDIAIMNKFFDERQFPDGQLGGGYGDDVELLRTWYLLACISSGTEKVRKGIEKLCQGVWDNVLKEGYDKTLGDVEHSAEPSADTLPVMLFMRYGDPLWVERNLRSCKTIKNCFMGIDNRGYPRFKSSWMGDMRVDETLFGGGDTGYNARVMKHFIWAAWQGNPDARDWFVRWADGWRAAIMRREGSKIPGYVPPTIWYPSGSIFPPVKGRPWWDEELNYCPRGDMILDVILAGYYFSADRSFLKAFQLAMELATRGPVDWKAKNPPGSKGEQLMSVLHYAGGLPTEQNKIALYRWLTGDTVYDEYLLRFGEPLHRYWINRDLSAYLATFKNAAERLRYNLELQTTEVLSTDRAALGSALSIFGAYTGAVTGVRDAATPTFAVTYDTPSADFAALVVHSSKERIRIWLYNFEDKPMPIGLKLWQLRPGIYVLSQGEQLPGEAPNQYRYRWISPRLVRILHRADGPTVTVPPGKVWVVDLRLDTPISVPATAPDMAVNTRDLVWTSKGLQVTVHNIGNSYAQPFSVILQEKVAEKWKTISEQRVNGLDYPSDFLPKTVVVTFPVKPSSAQYRVVIDPVDAQYELYEGNNICLVPSKTSY